MNRYYSTFVCSVLAIAHISAQTGKYDLSFSLHDIDCEAMQIYIDIQIKAHDANSTFHVSEQNYRVSFNEDVITSNSASIENELDVSGYLQSATGFSMYDPHTLVGSKDSIVSYNITLNSGEGVFLNSEKWTNVGRLKFNIRDPRKTAKFTYRNEDMFPGTFVGEIFRENRYYALEGDLHELEIDLSAHCPNNLPVSTDEAELERSIKLFPTPATHTIQLDCADNNCNESMIMDTQGRIVQRFNHNSSSTQNFDIATLPSGIYFIHIQVDDAIIVRKFVKS